MRQHALPDVRDRPLTHVGNASRLPSRASLILLAFVFAVSIPSCDDWLGGDAGSSQTAGEDLRPNIFLITVDTLRADHLGCYGYPKETSPAIDRFASEALLFEEANAHAPVTSSSCASILSGFLPHETKVLENRPLPSQVETLPEILEPLGYKRLAVVSNYVLQVKNGWSEGFDLYDHELDDMEDVRRTYAERRAEKTANRAIELMREHRDERLFLWVHFQDPHGPYTPPPAYQDMFRQPDAEKRTLPLSPSLSGRGGIPTYQRLGGNRDYNHYVSQYDGEIRYLDDHFDRLISAMKDLDLYDDAVIIFTADHGEGMGNHQYYFAHGENLYTDLTHVPLIIRYGGRIGRSAESVQHIDLVPTLRSVLGLEVDSRLRGRNLLADATGAPAEIFAEMDSPTVRGRVKMSLVYDGYKMIHTPLFDSYELYDLRTDFHETRNLLNDSSQSSRSEFLKARLKAIAEEDRLGIESGIGDNERIRTEEELETLRALGYVR
jgi:arylsulfatase A-like enzyme